MFSCSSCKRIPSTSLVVGDSSRIGRKLFDFLILAWFGDKNYALYFPHLWYYGSVDRDGWFVAELDGHLVRDSLSEWRQFDQGSGPYCC